MNFIRPTALTPSAFSPYGDVIECRARPDLIINNGSCARHHDLASLSFVDGSAAISLFDAVPRNLPYRFSMVERHPLGSQAFIPMSETSFLIIVADDNRGVPGMPKAFLSAPGQGVNFHANVWHGVLTPLTAPGLFAVIDRVGPGDNLEEYEYDAEFKVLSPGDSDQ